MRQARLFLRLRPAEQLLLLGALPLVALVRLGLRLLPFTLWRPLLQPAAPTPARRSRRAPLPAGRLAWAVTTVSPYVPGATCLTQALAARALLGWCGHPAVVRIGVARTASGALDAHAWVESAGLVLVGGPASHVARYTPLPATERPPL